MTYLVCIRMFFVIACYIFIVNITEAEENLCPPYEVTSPCGCVGVGSTVRLECVRVKTLADIRRAVVSLNTYSSRATEIAIDLMLLNFEFIPSDLFSGVPVNIISFTKCEFDAIGDVGQPAFLGLENSLKELSVSFSIRENKGLKFMNLSNLKALDHLEVEGNNIDVLKDEWFTAGPKTLQNVIFMTNSIQSLGSNVFSQLKSIKNLWITGNALTGGILRSMLPNPALHLLSIDLTNNKISSLPEDIFTYMPSLKEVILDENGIQSLPSSTWKPIWSQLSRVYLKDNPLNCDKNMDWLLNRKRPYVLKANCVAPSSKKGQSLKELIDKNENDEAYSYLLILYIIGKNLM